MANAAIEFDYNDFCPSCGQWDCDIVVEFGWCSSCVIEHLPNFKACEGCGRPFKVNSDTKDRFKKFCHTCKEEVWIARNADRLEEVILEFNCSFKWASQTVRQENRPHCAICGKIMAATQRTLNPNKLYLFCKEHYLIGRAVYRKVSGGMDEETAFGLVLKERNIDEYYVE